MIWILLLSLPFIYLSTYRDLSIGTDTDGVYYHTYFLGYAASGWKTPIREGLYIIFLRIVYWLKADYRFLLLVTSSIICLGFIAFFVARRRAINPMISIVCFMVIMFPFSMNAQRQVLAITLWLLAMVCLENEKPVVAGIIIVVAAFFHLTALILFIYYIPYLLGKKERLKKKIPYIFFLAPLALPVMLNLAIHLPFSSKYARYAVNFSLSGISTKFFLFPLLMLPLILVYWNRLIEINSSNYLHLCGYIFIFSTVFLSGYYIFAFRVMYYFIPSEIVLVGQLEKCCRKGEKAILNSYIIVALIVTFLVVYVFHDTDSIYPYVLGNGR
jgi:hypothetical protein